MTECARDATIQDLTAAPGEYARSSRENYWGTAGWADQPEVEDLGSASNGGRTLARVTIYEGKPIGVPPQPGQALGHKVLVQILGPLFAIPPKGTQVALIFPGGDTETPGNGYINGWAQSSPSNTAAQLSSARAVLDVGATMDLALKGQRVVLADHNGDVGGQTSSWLMVGPDPSSGQSGIFANDPSGAGLSIANAHAALFATNNGATSAALQLSPTGFGLACPFASSLITCDANGNVGIGAAGSLALVGANVSIGPAATNLTPALYGPTGMAGVASLTVFISP